MGQPLNYRENRRMENMEKNALLSNGEARHDERWTAIEHFVTGWIDSFEGIPADDDARLFTDYHFGEMRKRSDDLIDTIRRFWEIWEYRQ